MSQRKDYRIKLKGHRDGLPFFDLIVPGFKAQRLAATDKETAAAEAALILAKQDTLRPIPTKAATRPTPRHVQPDTLRAGFAAYLASATFDVYKPLTKSQRRSQIEIILRMPASNGRGALGDVKLIDWLQHPDAPEAVRRVMSLCGTKAAQANHLLKALDQFFIWLLNKDEPQAGEARLKFGIGKHAANPCRGVAKAKPKRSKNGRVKHGYTPFTGDQVEHWLKSTKDNPAMNRVVRFLQITGARISDLIRLNRAMIKDGVLTYTCEKGKDSAFRADDSVANVPMVPELQALIAELPHDQLMFITKRGGKAYETTQGLDTAIRKSRRACGLPEGLSAHSMRKAATHWWLREHHDLIKSGYSLKTIFGWETDKELENYTKNFDRTAEARGMLIRLADRRKARPAG